MRLNRSDFLFILIPQRTQSKGVPILQYADAHMTGAAVLSQGH